MQLGSFIAKNDKEAAEQGQDAAEEIEEVFEVLSMHHRVVYVLFDVYAAIGTS